MYLLADDASKLVENPATAVVSTIDGITTALVLFVLAALVFPNVIKNRRQFFLIVIDIMLLIVLHALTLMLRSTPFTVFAGVLTGVLQMVGIGLAVMSAGGMNAGELSDEMKRSYEVLRRGESEKEIIIPIGGGGGGKKSKESEPRTVYTIDTPPGPAARPGSLAGAPPAPRATPPDAPIPLE